MLFDVAGRRPSLGKYAASSPRAWGHWFWTIFTSPRSLKSGENLRGGSPSARPTTDIRSECFHLAFVFPADGVSMDQKWRGEKKERGAHQRRARTSKKLRSQTVTKTFSASRPWFSSSCSAREMRGVRKPRDAAMNNEFHLSFMRKGVSHGSIPKVTRLNLYMQRECQAFFWKLSSRRLFFSPRNR